MLSRLVTKFLLKSMRLAKVLNVIKARIQAFTKLKVFGQAFKRYQGS